MRGQRLVITDIFPTGQSHPRMGHFPLRFDGVPGGRCGDLRLEFANGEPNRLTGFEEGRYLFEMSFYFRPVNREFRGACKGFVSVSDADRLCLVPEPRRCLALGGVRPEGFGEEEVAVFSSMALMSPGAGGAVLYGHIYLERECHYGMTLSITHLE